MPDEGTLWNQSSHGSLLSNFRGERRNSSNGPNVREDDQRPPGHASFKYPSLPYYHKEIDEAWENIIPHALPSIGPSRLTGSAQPLPFDEHYPKLRIGVVTPASSLERTDNSDYDAQTDPIANIQLPYDNKTLAALLPFVEYSSFMPGSCINPVLLRQDYVIPIDSPATEDSHDFSETLSPNPSQLIMTFNNHLPRSASPPCIPSSPHPHPCTISQPPSSPPRQLESDLASEPNAEPVPEPEPALEPASDLVSPDHPEPEPNIEPRLSPASSLQPESLAKSRAQTSPIESKSHPLTRKRKRKRAAPLNVIKEPSPSNSLASSTVVSSSSFPATSLVDNVVSHLLPKRVRKRPSRPVPSNSVVPDIIIDLDRKNGNSTKLSNWNWLHNTDDDDENNCCYCYGICDGPVFTCASTHCRRKQYHLRCAGVHSKSTEKPIHCPACHEKVAKPNISFPLKRIIEVFLTHEELTMRLCEVRDGL